MFISDQLDKIHKGVINVVNNTKYKDIPSIPKLNWQKFNWLNSDINWYWVLFESNKYHKNNDTKKLIK